MATTAEALLEEFEADLQHDIEVLKLHNETGRLEGRVRTIQSKVDALAPINGEQIALATRAYETRAPSMGSDARSPNSSPGLRLPSLYCCERSAEYTMLHDVVLMATFNKFKAVVKTECCWPFIAHFLRNRGGHNGLPDLPLFADAAIFTQETMHARLKAYLNKAIWTEGRSYYACDDKYRRYVYVAVACEYIAGL
ncbi:hypothetical protein SPRG_04422 [Saprolegnia parasitica CBS 223.65]|uniref:Uncharacterized protein n=1 Tax=Saprolegnia parasitica (strain CBS 223.65) TaxID=695850 RepID=A0A067CVF8_SAPPC|nr:hypothetical protein SPRG_04422 [Saprolegnia parasitica CBS 223.65]KDO30521.1 hypothetical protein SPRG_04422 [Saprolegnia parasitica CBS 223.65]|eukprot:XP_012198736.1 hypothetical protein SPRG_04422 [Saprolegnia parasitica CBS 223.65]